MKQQEVSAKETGRDYRQRTRAPAGGERQHTLRTVRILARFHPIRMALLEVPPVREPLTVQASALHRLLWAAQVIAAPQLPVISCITWKWTAN
ncbi:hypothetical protein GDO78_015561 [Eleutherodactylus coqui]|uniref:Uncharacterized protein n=1 Tax=Eleutherodactylus coqui TaxID=57060 RepID=A0A8J6BEU9_ELECQ|nr:hypothetical protein GDO78_015561 [Eleutherodactylus coqui]